MKLQIQNRKEKLHTFIDGYAVCDIYDRGETGLVFRALHNKSLFMRGDKYIGEKMSEARIKVQLYGNKVLDDDCIHD